MKFEDFLRIQEKKDNELFENYFNEIMKEVENKVETLKKAILEKLEQGNKNIELQVKRLSELNELEKVFGNKVDTLIGQSVEIAIYEWLKNKGYLAFVEWGSQIIVRIYSSRLKERMERYNTEKKSKDSTDEMGEFVKVETVI